MTAVVQYEVGRIRCGQIREFLEAEKFKGRTIDWIESKGIISRLFTIKGDSA
jgi:hypothetical protein